MPSIKVSLPEDLYAEVKGRGLPASELLQAAVRSEIRRLDLVDETDRYLAELEAEVGPSSPEDVAAAEELVARIARHFDGLARGGRG